jgi:hypothetical protein
MERIAGGLYRLDISLDADDENDKLWTVHFDCLLELRPDEKLYEPRLKNIWNEITGDSYIIKLQVVTDTNFSKYKLTRYIMKPPFKRFADDTELLAIYKAATRKRKKVQKFGTWMNTAKEPERWHRPQRAKRTIPDPPEPTAEELEQFRREAMAILGIATVMGETANIPMSDPISGDDLFVSPTSSCRSVDEQHAAGPLAVPSAWNMSCLVDQEQLKEEEGGMAAVEIRVLHQCTESVPLNRMNDCDVKGVLCLERG